MQGLSGDRVLVLVDGQPLSARTASTVDLSQIPVEDVERIEVAKGAVSTLYGSRAMGGVINVITRDSADRTRYSLQVDAGTHGDKNRDGAPSETHASASVGGGFGRASLGVNADVRASRGYDLDPDTYDAEGYDGTRSSLGLRAGYELGGGARISTRPSYYREDVSRPFDTFAPGQGQIRKEKIEEVERVRVPVSLALPAGRSHFELTALYERFDERSAQDVLSTPAVDQERDALIELERGELQWDRPFGENHLVTGGLVAFRETLSQEQTRVEGSRTREIVEIEPGAERESVEAYLQDDIFLGERWEAVPGIRYHHDSDFGGFATPKINLFYQQAGADGFTTNVRFGVGRGYRTPNLKERFFVFDHSALGYMVLGNPDLEPERSTSYQFGVEWVQPGAWRVDANLFHNRLTDLITTAFDEQASQEAGLQIFRYQNIERATTQGLELVASRRLSRAWRLEGAYTHLRAEDESTGNTLPERPRHQARLGLQWEPVGWRTSVDLNATYRSEEYVDTANTQESPAWTRWDLRINTDVTRHLTAFVGVDNLTDVHREPDDALDQRPIRPRFAYVGLRFSH
jgi:outer membrane receptor for ferrienterochelin and colicins